MTMSCFEDEKVLYLVQHVFTSCARLVRKCIICIMSVKQVPYVVQHVFTSCARLVRRCFICSTTCLLHDTQHFVFGTVDGNKFATQLHTVLCCKGLQ